MIWIIMAVVWAIGIIVFLVACRTAPELDDNEMPVEHVAVHDARPIKLDREKPVPEVKE